MSNFVKAGTMREALAIVAQCHVEGFKAVASENLNGTGWLIEYWK